MRDHALQAAMLRVRHARSQRALGRRLELADRDRIALAEEVERLLDELLRAGFHEAFRGSRHTG